jgi:hypothetical protein
MSAGGLYGGLKFSSGATVASTFSQAQPASTTTEKKTEATSSNSTPAPTVSSSAETTNTGTPVHDAAATSATGAKSTAGIFTSCSVSSALVTVLSKNHSNDKDGPPRSPLRLCAASNLKLKPNLRYHLGHRLRPQPYPPRQWRMSRQPR